MKKKLICKSANKKMDKLFKSTQFRVSADGLKAFRENEKRVTVRSLNLKEKYPEYKKGVDLSKVRITVTRDADEPIAE